MFFDSDEDQSVSYWPSVSDLFMALFIIGLVLVALTHYILTPQSKIPLDESVIIACGTDMKNIRKPVNRMRVALPIRPPLSDGQSAKEVVEGLNITSKDVVEALHEANSRNIETQQIVKSINLMRKSLGKVALEEGKSPKETVSGLEETARDVVDELEKLRGGIAKINKELNDKPPIIQIKDSDKYRFPSGSAEMDENFSNNLNQNEFKILADEIVKRNSGGDLKVDTLEVIGHTDGQAFRRAGNLDDRLPSYLTLENSDLGLLLPGSNNDLGLLRALALKKAWIKFIDSHDDSTVLKKVQVRCYSAGQTILDEDADPKNQDSYRQANPKARRIEIRLTKLKI
jgi:outer membrane protein OmpA-like peptidoglycan-associated protein